MHDFGSQELHTTSPALGKPLIASFSNSEIRLRIDLIGECTSPIEEVWRRYSQGGRLSKALRSCDQIPAFGISTKNLCTQAVALAPCHCQDDPVNHVVSLWARAGPLPLRVSEHVEGTAVLIWIDAEYAVLSTSTPVRINGGKESPRTLYRAKSLQRLYLLHDFGQ